MHIKLQPFLLYLFVLTKEKSLFLSSRKLFLSNKHKHMCFCEFICVHSESSSATFPSGFVCGRLRYPRNVPPPPAPCHSELARQAFIILSSCILRLRGFNVHKVGVVGSFDRQVDPDPPATSKRTWAGKIFFRSIKKI